MNKIKTTISLSRFFFFELYINKFYDNGLFPSVITLHFMQIVFIFMAITCKIIQQTPKTIYSIFVFNEK